ncbi:hypothetical protein [Mucilaginibacter flavus]|uniref:hypothetical protein n=1 Tax=Mucilaginibacter flavus TaxID=931504 RepID=UPI0025B36FD5|nr:hypothetical protein [Mucilaginibacter flavus]MDN3584587.1 hypothetical protein [Mucilaginibacter flavus]
MSWTRIKSVGAFWCLCVIDFNVFRGIYWSGLSERRMALSIPRFSSFFKEYDSHDNIDLSGGLGVVAFIIAVFLTYVSQCAALIRYLPDWTEF